MMRGTLFQIRRMSFVPRFFAEPDSLTDIQSRLIYKDKNFIAINKPYGLAVHGGPKVKNDLQNHLHKFRFDRRLVPQLVHRLDEYTTGVLVLSRSSEAARMAAHWFQKKQIVKIYHALVLGKPDKKEGIIDVPLKVGMSDLDHKNTRKYIVEANIGSDYGKEAVTKYTTLETFEGPNGTFSYLELQLMTGQRHQLRVHCCDVLRCPIVGDHIRTQHKLYTSTHLKGLRIKRAHLPLLKMHLHASRIELPPDVDEGITTPTIITAPLSPHIATTLKWLQGNKEWYDPMGPLILYDEGRKDIPTKKKKKFIKVHNLPEDYENNPDQSHQTVDRPV